MLTVGSLFSGVGGLDLGLQRAGMRVVFQCESDAWCRGILAQHWPDIPCFEDVGMVGVRQRQVNPGGRATAAQGRAGSAPTVDLLCGGFPCQDLSVAGRRRGLAGERSGLFFEFARCADELVRPGGWLLVENVPGLLSSQGGRDFGVVVRTLGDIGFHDLAWRVLDSRYFGVPQRRRRVYIVARRAAGRGAREVLLEPESGGGDFETGAETWPQVAHVPANGFERTGAVGTLGGAKQRGGWRFGADEAAAGQLINTTSDTDGVRASSGLSGWVDDPRPDGPRYAAIGNAVTVPVAVWIGQRIVSYENGR